LTLGSRCFRTFPEGTALTGSSHGSACLEQVLDGARFRDLSDISIPYPLLYRGSTHACPRRGVARTRPWAARLAAAHLPRNSQPPNVPVVVPAGAPIVLELGERPWAGVPCWTGRAQRWAGIAVPVAYAARYDTVVRPAMPGNPVSLKSLVKVATARADYAEHATGRGCRPSNERLAADTGLSVRTVQRASTALRLLGVATEVLRGRQRTRTERLASWRVGDRGRGWASVWALHDSRLTIALSPHPEGSSLFVETSRRKVVTTATARRAGGGRGARRRDGPDEKTRALARAWRADRQTPQWVQRHTTGAWARVLAAPARHGWCARDVNQLIRDWVGVGHWLPERPHKPIGLLGAILAWHGLDNLDDHPAAAEMARDAADLAAHHQHLANQAAARTDAARTQALGRQALTGPGYAAARAAAAEATRHAAERRTAEAAAAAVRFDAAVRAARGLDTEGGAKGIRTPDLPNSRPSHYE
jgi:hypothetical protein